MENKKTNFVYINPNFSHNQPNKSTSVVGGMHINPNFKGIIKDFPLNAYRCNALATPNIPKIHFNPRMLQRSVPGADSAPLLVVADQQNVGPTQDHTAYVVNNRNKFIRSVVSKANAPIRPTTHKNEFFNTVLPSVVKKPSYSLLRKDTTAKKVSCKQFIKATSEPSEKLAMVSKSIDWRKKLRSPGVTYSAYSMRKRKSLVVNLSKLKRQKKNDDKFKMNSRSAVFATPNISRVLKNTSKSICIGGEKYVIKDNILQKVSKSNKARRVGKIHLCGVAYVRKSSSVFVMDNRFHNSASKRKKINVTCPVFRRLGVCKKVNQGKCPLTHDPRNISICQKFLKGICKVDGCYLSHQVVLEKMPTCKFFLEGCCTRENCPYLHVKVNASAKICPSFLNGYCQAGANCLNKHINVCPTFYKYSKCDKSKCPYSHKMAPKSVESEAPDCKVPSVFYCKGITSDKEGRVDIGGKEEDNCEQKALRYFEKNNECANRADGKEVLYKGKSKLGHLPSFISLQ